MQSKEKCTSVGQGPYMEPSEDFNECCYNSTGEDLKKKLFPSAFLQFGCCESRRGKICRVCIGAKNWRRIYKSS
jgi:hypothetical protein